MRDRFRQSLLVPAALILATSCARGAADPAASLRTPPEGVFADDWYAVLVSDQKSGHLHIQGERKGDVIHTRTDLVVEVARGKSKIQVSLSSEEVETIAGDALGFSVVQKLGGGRVAQEGRIDGGELRIVSEQFGQKLERKAPWNPEARMSWGTHLALLETGLLKGVEFTIPVFDPTLGADAETEFRIGDEETIDLMGRKAKATRISSKASLRTVTLDNAIWVDRRYRSLAMETSFGAIRLRMVSCPKDIALEPGDPAELFVSTLVPVDRALDRRRIRTLSLRFRVEGAEDLSIPETGLQRVKKTGPGVWEIEIERGRRDADPQDEGTLRRFLRPSTYANGDDPKIRAMADEAAGDEEDPARIADLLRRHVTRSITRKNLNVGFATASEVAVTREGDCSEHAVLLAALGRAKGIPSRAAAGLIYLEHFGGKRDVFAFHMWTQMYIGGRWQDLDAMFDQTEADATHIALAILPLAEEDSMDFGLEILAVAGRCTIGVLKVVEEKAGEPAKAAAGS
ncbi:MAG: transglutaminase domain-containing protein [Planctomycetes bacterium]|nr:transglutaminase domain-containing protein [Planctomycetota bacterium]